MSSVEEKLGYLVAKVEELSDDSKKMGEQLNALERKVEDKFRTAEIVFRVLKFTGLAILAILTFKFGDVRNLWLTFFS